jgi:hypothetical protein
MAEQPETPDDSIPPPPPHWGDDTHEGWPGETTLFDQVAIGDTVEHVSGERWIVTHIGWGTITVRRTKILRRPEQWRLVAKARHTEEPP